MNRIKNWATSVQAWMVTFLILVLLVAAYYVVTDRVTPITTDAYVQTFVVPVAARVEGQVIEVNVSQGSTVKKGDPLFRLEPRPYQYTVDRMTATLVLAETNIRSLQAQLSAGKAVIAQRQADVDLAQATFDRISALTDDSFATLQQRDQATDTLKSDRALLQQAKADVEDLQTQLDSMVGDEHSQIAQARAQLRSAKFALEQTTIHA